MGILKRIMMEQDSNIETGRKTEWIKNELSGKEVQEESEEWQKLSEEFDNLRDIKGYNTFDSENFDNNNMNIEFIEPPLYDKNSFPGMRESGGVKSTKKYTIAEYEDRDFRLLSVAENIKNHIDEHFILYDYKGSIRTNSAAAIKVIEGIYHNGLIVNGDSLHVSGGLDIQPLNRGYISEADTINRIYQDLLEYVSSHNVVKEKRILGNRMILDIAITDNQDNIVAFIEVKNKLRINANKFINNVKEQVSKYYNAIMTKQTIKPYVFIVALDDNSKFNFYSYDINLHTISVSHISILVDLLNYQVPGNNFENNSNKPQNTYTSFDKDLPDINTEDILKIEKDIDAFAKLIALQELQTPLSIGLFGKWGSGKSFFMEKLSSKIESYTKEKNNSVFCSDVVHVRFNAWYYSDTNLWASMVCKIFNEIDDYIKNKDKTLTKSEIKKHLFYRELSSSKETIEKKNILLSKVKVDIESLNKEKLALQKKYKATEQNLKLLEFTDYTKEILEEPSIKKQINHIKNELFIEKEINYRDIENIYSQLQDIFGSFINAFRLLIKNKKIRTIFFILLFIGGLVSVSVSLFKEAFFSGWTLFSLSSLMPFFIDMKLAISKVLIVKNNLNSLLSSIKKVEDNKRDMHYDETKNIKEQEQKLQKDLETIETDIKIEFQEQERIQQEIEAIENGQFFKDFILERVSSTDYTKHLGLISTIRDDFTDLEEFLLSKNNNKQYNIDRIILYVDDLDRCSNELVVEVLEAIHLLLAFKLFVVVVGVDSRWIKGSLAEKHHNFNNSDLKITPKQYIEKIFQIPFKVKLPSSEDKIKFVRDLLKREEFKKENLALQSNMMQSSEVREIREEIQTSNIERMSEDELEQKQNLHERLKFQKEEIDYIEKISNLIGDTPRTIKRFINVYRIIRSHADINNILWENFQNYKMIILLLCKTFWEEDNTKSFSKELEKINPELLSDYSTLDNIYRMKVNDLIERFSFDM